jgi:hypothetical protein
MLPTYLDGWGWLLLSLGPLLYLQKRLHFEIQAVFLLLTHSIEISIAFFSLIFFPGVLVHELSHFLMAKILGVKTGRISLIPRSDRKGYLRMGYVETVKTDPLRDTLIGIAPLISGGLIVAYIGLVRLHFADVWLQAQATGFEAGFNTLIQSTRQPDFWIWFYLGFTVSSMMLPSESDRRSWLTIGLWIFGLLVISIFAGAGTWLLDTAAPKVDLVMTSIAEVLFISDIIHLVLLIPVWIIRLLLRKITGYEVS